MSVKLLQSVRYVSAELLQVGCLNGWYAINCAELMKICLSASDSFVLICEFEPTGVIIFLVDVRLIR
jgi:hypothetical protein